VSRAALFCPGRGAYTRKTLRSLPAEHPFVDQAEELRREYGLPSLRELDTAKWKSDLHLRADNVSPLIYLVTMLDVEEAARRHELVCVGGNSMGWYTALAAGGALSFADGFRLVQEMAQLQMQHEEGGQILYPLVDEQWRLDPARVRAVEEILRGLPGEAFPSIALGGIAVLAGTETGVERLLDTLPPIEMGPQIFPYRLKQHGPYHTALLEPVAEKARALRRLDWRRPAVTLIDGRGARYTPWSTDPDELAAYTLGPQITTPFGFTTTVRVALREYAPDLLALPGPGNTLGSICGHVLVMEGYRGIHSRADVERDPTLLWSMRREA